MTITELKARIRMIIKKGFIQPVTPFIHGAPGVGKSESVYQIAEELGIGFIDLRLSQLESADLRGIPVPNIEIGSSKWLPPETIPFEAFANLPIPETYPINKGKKFKDGGILFLDEFNRARFDVQQAAFQLVLDRAVGLHKMLDNWYIVAAGNLGEDDGTDVNEMDSALNNRFAHFTATVNDKVWLDWAEKAGVHPDVIGFIQAKPGYLQKKIKEDDNVILTPRSWKKFSDILNQNSDTDPKDVAELVGASIINGAAAQFVTWLDQKSIVSPLDVLTKYKTMKKRIKAMQRDQVYGLNEELSGYISKNWKGAKEGEYEKAFLAAQANGENKETAKKTANAKADALLDVWLENIHAFTQECLEKDIYIAFMQNVTRKCSKEGNDFIDYYLKKYIAESKDIVAALTKR